MVMIFAGAALVLIGIVFMAAQPLWRGRLSREPEPENAETLSPRASNTLEPRRDRQGLRYEVQLAGSCDGCSRVPPSAFRRCDLKNVAFSAVCRRDSTSASFRQPPPPDIYTSSGIPLLWTRPPEPPSRRGRSRDGHGAFWRTSYENCFSSFASR